MTKQDTPTPKPKPKRPKRVRVLSADTVITFRAPLDGGGRIDVATVEIAKAAQAIADKLGLRLSVVAKPTTAPMVDAEVE